jgi:hypothetical protein
MHDASASLSLEERLREIRGRCRLLACIFSLHAEGGDSISASLSADACTTLADLCRSSADDLEQIARDMPGPLANWHATAPIERLDTIETDQSVKRRLSSRPRRPLPDASGPRAAQTSAASAMPSHATLGSRKSSRRSRPMK